MNRFNLEFTGSILPDRDPEQVKARFGRFFAIDDPTRLERFFSGQTIVLRRNLGRKDAAEYFAALRKLGIETRLVKVNAGETAANDPSTPSSGKPTVEADHRVRPSPQQELPLETPPEEVATPGADADAPASAAAAGLASRERPRGRQTARQKALEKKARRKQAKKAAQRTGKQARTRKEPRSPARPAMPAAAGDDSARRPAGEPPQPAETRKKAADEVETARQRAEAAARDEQRREAAARQALEEESARQRALREAEQQRREAEETERREAAAQRAREEQAARQRALREAEQQRREAEEAERREAAAQRAREEQAAHRRALEETEEQPLDREASKPDTRPLPAERESAKQRGRRDADYARRLALQAMEDQAMRRAASALTQQPALKPAAPRAKRDVSIAPLLKARRPATTPTGKPRRRQPGAPNIYSLNAFRNTPQVRNRAAVAGRRMRNGMQLGVAALAALLLLGGRYLSLPAPEILAGAGAVAVDGSLRPVMVAGERLLLHDRSGTGAGEIRLDDLGLTALASPIGFNAVGDLLGVGTLAGSGTAPEPEAAQLVRCKIDPPGCQAFTAFAAGAQVSALAIHPLTGAVFAADTESGELLKFSAGGELIARASVAMPAQPVLRLDSGLLFINSAQGPAVSVFRYEDSAFGRQLDEILLLPPVAVAAQQTRTRDFLATGDSWWAILDNPETGAAGLYRFDAQWNPIGRVAQLPDARPVRLVAWGERVLLHDSGRVPLQRFNARGGREAPWVSEPLEGLVEGQERWARLTRVAWQGALGLCALLALLGLGYAWLQHLRALVYKPRRERGADPVDERADAVDWVDPVDHRSALMRRRVVSYTLLAFALLLVAAGIGVSTLQLAALIVVLSGPAVALAVLRRSRIGHIGVLNRELVLVDHAGTYHLGSGARIQHRGNLVMIDDVVVFTGNRLLPAFDPKQITSQVRPLVQTGVRVDRKTALVKLLQSRHPLARGAAAIVLGLLAGILLLSLPG